MSIIIYLINSLAVLYIFARKYIEKEPLKSDIENVVNSIDDYLRELKDIQHKLMIKNLAIFSRKIAITTFVLFSVISVFLPKAIASFFVTFLASAFTISLFVHLSIILNQEYRKTIKYFLGNSVSIFLIFSPTLISFVDSYYNQSFIRVFDGFNHLLKINNLIYLQVYWAFTIIIAYFIFVFAIAPVYYILYACIFMISIFINTIDKHLNNKSILDFVVALIVAVTAICRNYPK
jgi:hypothetical protein